MVSSQLLTFHKNGISAFAMWRLVGPWVKPRGFELVNSSCYLLLSIVMRHIKFRSLAATSGNAMHSFREVLAVTAITAIASTRNVMRQCELLP